MRTLQMNGKRKSKVWLIVAAYAYLIGLKMRLKEANVISQI